ncbi:MAG: hypothetical protein DRJ96_07460 [Thermoprotei archaeon]|nr:MAG: hypothetical protein DRJ67_04610 [Thermoprotei archaeon]RLE96075.1 MAG: hypothetical protein DRJ96_07460 [Thermoprotei archaeon]
MAFRRVLLVSQPNVGESSLLNALTGAGAEVQISRAPLSRFSGLGL